ncbi:MAG: CDP-glycerol glycerophosphotransferase family protein [Actinomycetes bacterium]|jgi:CDP-glycerol glycerophosphotransferase|nr:CDP-glycerol glycerophosphotransferase family protein [Actinomycetes bacterium]
MAAPILQRGRAPILSILKKSRLLTKLARDLLNAYLRAGYRRYMRRNPTEPKTILFEAYMGRSYACHPKAIYQDLLADPAFDEYRFIWAFDNPEKYADDPRFARAELVVSGSPAYRAACARAAVWVTNSRMPEYLVVKPDQTYLQGWHGTPYKRLGADIAIDTDNAMNSTKDLARRYARDAARFTWLVSPSPFTTDKFRSAFSLDAQGKTDIILEYGYPRNDYLCTVSAQQIIETKQRLGLPQEKNILLYAPTWRDDMHDSASGYYYRSSLDFHQLHETLGDQWLVLFRAHYFITNSFDFASLDGFVRNVTDVDDINDLFVVSDVLVTDYSSVFFDYANLYRPIIFYMYDKDHYQTGVRDTYLSTNELPGKITETQDEFLSALREIPEVRGEIREGLARFNRRFNPYSDGLATRRVIDRVWHGIDPGPTRPKGHDA